MNTTPTMLEPHEEYTACEIHLDYLHGRHPERAPYVSKSRFLALESTMVAYKALAARNLADAENAGRRLAREAFTAETRAAALEAELAALRASIAALSQLGEHGEHLTAAAIQAASPVAGAQ